MEKLFALNNAEHFICNAFIRSFFEKRSRDEIISVLLHENGITRINTIDGEFKRREIEIEKKKKELEELKVDFTSNVALLQKQNIDELEDSINKHREVWCARSEEISRLVQRGFYYRAVYLMEKPIYVNDCCFSFSSLVEEIRKRYFSLRDLLYCICSSREKGLLLKNNNGFWVCLDPENKTVGIASDYSNQRTYLLEKVIGAMPPDVPIASFPDYTSHNIFQIPAISHKFWFRQGCGGEEEDICHAFRDYIDFLAVYLTTLLEAKIRNQSYRKLRSFIGYTLKLFYKELEIEQKYLEASLQNENHLDWENVTLANYIDFCRRLNFNKYEECKLLRKEVCKRLDEWLSHPYISLIIGENNDSKPKDELLNNSKSLYMLQEISACSNLLRSAYRGKEVLRIENVNFSNSSIVAYTVSHIIRYAIYFGLTICYTSTVKSLFKPKTSGHKARVNTPMLLLGWCEDVSINAGIVEDLHTDEVKYGQLYYLDYGYEDNVLYGHCII